jgi:hypothetical protein
LPPAVLNENETKQKTRAAKIATTTKVMIATWERQLAAGGPKGIRTLDLSDANRTLSQLSYGPGYTVSYKTAYLF